MRKLFSAMFVVLFFVSTQQIVFAGEKLVPEKFVNNFLQSIVDKKMSTAFDLLKKISETKEEFASLQKMKISLETDLPTFGEPISYEKVKKEKYGQSIVRLVYVLKLDKGPVVWEFYFYRPRDSWKIKNMNYSGNISSIR